ncbi:hypothetical protein LPJ61_006035 [Coemansia biformis]|uniref:Uncharacterized protein n=1 Tax=Coemansia biformis TaxID=1286918 RepID=A0A9W7XYU1_9FUNG|nr:hypothetical protein LPJ61_006035 [Coemansia biformis]
MEFSQRPAHAPLSGAHGFITAAVGAPPPPPSAHAHYAYPGQDSPQPVYSAAAAYAQPAQHQPSADSYAGVARRLPSVSELLVTPDSAAAIQQPAPYAVPCAQPSLVAQQQQQQHYMAGAYGQGAYPPTSTPKAYGVDVPGLRAPDHGPRDSEPASSVSSHSTLIDKHSPAAYHHTGAKQYHLPSPPAATVPAATAVAAQRDMYEDDVFVAANILMSLRTCKMPC